MANCFWDVTFQIGDDSNETVLICINDELLEPGFTEDTVVEEAATAVYELMGEQVTLTLVQTQVREHGIFR
jgi:hypothetical protein